MQEESTMSTASRSAQIFEENNAAFALRGLLAVALHFCARDPYHMHCPLQAVVFRMCWDAKTSGSSETCTCQGPFYCSGNTQGSAGMQGAY